MSWLHSLNLISGISLGVIWLYHAVAAQRGLRRVPVLGRAAASGEGHVPESSPSARPLPRVSIIVPARNEEAMIEAAVRSLLALDYPDFEVVVVDDRSEDATGAILERLVAESDARLQLLHVRELPPGWLGKTHAMWRGAAVATGQWLLFTDADVVHQTQSLRLAVDCATRHDAAHMVLMPTMRTHTLGERMMIGFFQCMFLFQHRPWKAADPASRDYLGVGAYNLVRRDAYEAIGSYESMRLCVVDDMRLAERLKQAGFPFCAAFGPNLVQIRWAMGATGVVRNLTKNFFAHLQFNLAFALLAALGMLWLHLGPWLGLGFAAGWARAGYGLAMAVLVASYAAMSRYSDTRPVDLLLHPAAAVLMTCALLLSTSLTLLRGGVLWRGTFYPLAELKRNS